jgi:RimJ/RimL family protein N-acetyltransferase
VIIPVTLDNAPHAVQLGCEVHALSSLRDIAFDWDFSLSCMRYITTDQTWHAEMAQFDGVHTGLMIGRVQPFTFSPRLFGDEVLWYVREGSPYRTRTAVELMQRFVDWAIDERGAVRVQSGDIANINSVAVAALYRYLGFAKYGTIFKYERLSTTKGEQRDVR